MNNNIKIAIYIVTLITIIFFALYIRFHIIPKNSQYIIRLEKKIKFLNEDIDLLLMNQMWMLKSEQTEINPELTLKILNPSNPLQNKLVKIREVTGEGKLFFYFGEHDCLLCYQEIINILNEYINKSNSKNIVIIADFENLRNLHFFSKNTKIMTSIYYITKSIDLPAIKARQPFFFSLDKSFKTKFLFVPDKKYNKNIETYLLFVDNTLNHKKMQ